jgi:UDP-2,3-diacylglucosamine pyrophosphatase LpxH
MKNLLKGLCKLNHEERSFLIDCNFDFFLKEKTNQEIKMCLWELSDKFTEQVTFCQFVFYLMKNAN